MLLKEIEKVCKYEKSVILYTLPDGSQWCGTGSALFPLSGMPENLSMDNVIRLLNISDAELEKIYKADRRMIKEDPSCEVFYDTIPDETEIEQTFPAIVANGILYNSYRISDGIMFINNKFVKAFKEKDVEYRFFERRSKSQTTPFLVVKRGLFIDGVIFPRQLCKDATFCDELSNMAALCSLEYDKHHGKE